MMRAVFVDTSAWVGLFAPPDQHHEEALEALEELREEGVELVTTDYVMTETVTRVRQLAGVQAATEAWAKLEEGDVGEVIDVTRSQRAAARRIFEKYAQLDLSLVDVVSFAVMKELGIREAFTFDGDFRKVGYAMLPRKK